MNCCTGSMLLWNVCVAPCTSTGSIVNGCICMDTPGTRRRLACCCASPSIQYPVKMSRSARTRYGDCISSFRNDDGPCSEKP